MIVLIRQLFNCFGWEYMKQGLSLNPGFLGVCWGITATANKCGLSRKLPGHQGQCMAILFVHITSQEAGGMRMVIQKLSFPVLLYSLNIQADRVPIFSPGLENSPRGVGWPGHVIQGRKQVATSNQRANIPLLMVCQTQNLHGQIISRLSPWNSNQRHVFHQPEVCLLRSLPTWVFKLPRTTVLQC